MFERGDLLLVPFSFTDLSATKRHSSPQGVFSLTRRSIAMAD
jgi:hypothetical protein